MAKIYDFKTEKLIKDRSYFLFGDEVVRKDSKQWKAMVVEQKIDGLIVMKIINSNKPEASPCFLFVGFDMVEKTGKSYTTKDNFIAWLKSERNTNV